MRYYLTTAIDYVNSRPHLGTAYEKITADVIARYHRLRGDDTWFLMGNDEHSQNVYRRATEAGKDPLVYCDEMAHVFTSVWRSLGISYDDFIRTTEPRHRTATRALAQACHDAGDIYEGVYEGWYCVSCEGFKVEKDLIDGLCPVHKTKPDWIREKNWFFRLSKYQGRLLRHFEDHPECLEPEVRRNEILRLIEGGLEDISMSRAGQSWGIPLPFDEGSVVYVWFDALINYAAAVGLGADPERLARWWPADLHVVGKDITRFHAVIWPAMLMSAGLPLPRQVFGHGWVHFRGERMSKSLGNIVDPLEAAERFGPDPLRLYLTKEIPYGGDGDFSWERFTEKYNADLANNLGNAVNRVAAMTERYRQGHLAPSGAPGTLAGRAAAATAAYTAAMDRLALHEATAAAFGLVSDVNGFIADTQPWSLAKDPAQADRVGAVLYDAAEALRIAAVLLTPVMPGSAADLRQRLDAGREAPVRLSDAAWRADAARQVLNSGALWPRIEGETVTAVSPVQGGTTVSESTPPPTPSALPQTPAAAVPAAAPAVAPVAATGAAAAAGDAVAADTRIAIDEFMKVELRVARILEAERVPKSKKLMKLTVDAGTETRTIVAGIAESYAPEQLTGRSIVIVANLKPAKLMGIESNGMVLAASPVDGSAVLLDPGPAAPGTRVR